MDKYNWYNREREYKYGDYKIINGKGYYYNEDSDKWVNRLNKKVIEEKYIRYEFSIYNDKDIEKEFGWSYIDRIGKFIFLLYKSGLEVERIKGKRFVFVDTNKMVLGILGSDYKDIIRRLDEELNIIDLRFSKGKFGKVKVEYKLNDLFFERSCYRRVVWIRNSRLIRFLDNFYKKDFKEDKYLLYEISVCKRLSLEYNVNGLNVLLDRRIKRLKEEDFIDKDWDFLSEKDKLNKRRGWDESRVAEYFRLGKVYFELLKLDIESLKYGGYNFRGFGLDENFSGRINNIINNKFREFRGLLKIDGDNLIDIDMVNGYVSLLYRVLKGIRDVEYGSSVFDDKIKDCLGDLNGNDFLEEYSICFDGNKDEREDFYNYLGVRLGNVVEMKFDKDVRRYYKNLVLYLINGEEEDGRRKKYINDTYSYDEIMELIFCKNGYAVIRKLKSSVFDFKIGKIYYGYERFKNMSKILMSMEVIIMKGIWDLLIAEKLCYISLYDGMLVKKKDKLRVVEIVESKLVGINSCIRMKYK